jgi:hypothetical protein
MQDTTPVSSMREKIKQLESLVAKLSIIGGSQDTIDACNMLIHRGNKLQSGDDDSASLSINDYFAMNSAWHESADEILSSQQAKPSRLNVPLLSSADKVA